ncbi:MAG: AAA family ATPase, partial [Promethearchaeota archaeon]
MKRIELKNFISHKDTKFDFPSGVSVFRGENGSGKSSIIDGIYYSICGEHVRGDRIDDLIRKGTNNAQVKLLFEHNGNDYEVVRRRETDGGPYAVIRENGTPKATIQTAVSDEIAKILGMDKDAIINSVFIRQGEITKLIDGRPAERKEVMAKLLEIDKLKKAYDYMKAVINAFEDKLKHHDVIKTKLEDNQEEKEKLELSIKELKDNVLKIEEEIKITEESLKKASKKKDLWEKKRESKEELTKKETELNEKMLSANKMIEKILKQVEEAKNAKEEAKRLRPQIKNIEHYESYIDFLNKKKNKENDIKTNTKDLDRVKGWHDKKEAYKEFYVKYRETEKKVEEQQKKLKNYNEIEIQVAGFNAEIKNYNEYIKEFQEKMTKIEKSTLKYLSNIDISEKQKLIRSLEDKVNGINNKIKNLIDLSGKMKGRIEEIDKYLEILGESTKCPVCSSDLTEEHRKKVSNNFREENINKKAQLKKIERQKQKLDEEESKLTIKLEKIKILELDRYYELKKKISDLQARISSIEERVIQGQIKLSEKSKLEENIEDHKKQMVEIKEEYESYKASEEALKSEMRNVDEIENQLQSLQSDLDKIKSSISLVLKNFKEKPKDSEKELKHLRDKKEKYNAYMVKSKKLEEYKQDLDKSNKELENLKANLKKTNEKIKELAYTKEDYYNAMKEYNEMKERVNTKKSNQDLLSKQIKDQETKLKEKEQLIQDFKEKLKEFKKIRNFNALLSKIRDAYSKDGLQKAIRKIFAPKITEFAKEYLDAFNINITDISIDEDLDITIIARQGKLSINSVSGGEKVAIAIILRLAIARLLSNQISTIIMDEPTTHLDKERRKELVDAMKNFKKESHIIPQLIVVTHHNELEDIADSLFEVNIIDNVSKVQEIF